MFLSWVLYIAPCIFKGRQRKTKTKSTHPRFIQKNMNKAESLPCFRKWMDEPRDPYTYIYILYPANFADLVPVEAAGMDLLAVAPSAQG